MISSAYGSAQESCRIIPNFSRNVLPIARSDEKTGHATFQ